jgi:murein DD-endopeptidase MepM/ murein hydrolase activator NlpD
VNRDHLMSDRSAIHAILVIATLFSAACASNGPLSELIRPSSPYERYASSLSAAGLDEAALGQDWIRAGDQALLDAMTVELPFRESGYFPSDRPSATAYRLQLQRGRRLVVDVTIDAIAETVLFVDLFEARNGEALRRVAALDSAVGTLTHDVDRGGVYLLRLQPELLRRGRFAVIARTETRIAFPVPGSSPRDVASSFSAGRDGGRRDHEGVDIFAQRGTPVVAAVDGIARTDTNQLGGNVVWLSGARTGPRFYYAHLDRWAIAGETRVREGDVIGYVGNTGNARTTPSHLHFGVYDDGAIDPMPFLQPHDQPPAAPGVDQDALGALARVTAARATVRAGAWPRAPARRHLGRAMVMRIVGASRRSYRVRLPDTVEGYVDASEVTRLDVPLRRLRTSVDALLLDAPRAEAPMIGMLKSGSEVEVLGRFESFDFVRDRDQRAGWVETSK